MFSFNLVSNRGDRSGQGKGSAPQNSIPKHPVSSGTTSPGGGSKK